MQQIARLEDYFSDKFQELKCDDFTRAYIISIFSKFKTAIDYYSSQSITIKYSQAQQARSFASFQNIGDFLFFCNSLYPEHLNGASIEYYHTLGQMSYLNCFKILNRNFHVYEHLADEFVPLSGTIRNLIQQDQYMFQLHSHKI